MNDLGQILKEIQKLLWEDDNLIQLSFGDDELLLVITEHEYPIRIHKVKIYDNERD